MSKLGIFKKELELSRDGDIVYGRCGDYIVTFSEQNREVELFVDARLGRVDSGAIDELKAFVQASAAGYKLVSFSMTSTGASVVVAKKNASLLLEFSALLISQLKTLGIPGAGICSNCGQPMGSYNIVRIANHAHACDSECASRLLAGASRQQPVYVRQQGSFLGFMGALLFVLLSAAAYAYLALNSYFCAWVAVIMPIAASLGYALFGGKPCAGKGTSVLLLPLLFFSGAAFFVLLYSVYLHWIDLGYVFSLRELISLVSKNLTAPVLKSEYLYKQVAEGFVFLLIGYIFSLPQAFSKKQQPRVRELS